MSSTSAQHEFREFHDRWSASVFTFCHLYLGDEALAAEATAEAFLAYIRDGLALDDNRLPIGLLRFALESAQRSAVLIVDDCEPAEFADWVLALPSFERAVFLLHGVFGLQFPWITAVTGGSYEQICQAWSLSLVRMRSHLPAFHSARVSETRPSNSRQAGYAPMIAGASQC